MITDGQIHDLEAATTLNLSAPLHALLTGEHDEGDRRLAVDEAPSYAIVGRPVDLKLQIDDLPVGHEATARLSIRRDGETVSDHLLPVGKDATVQLTLERGRTKYHRD